MLTFSGHPLNLVTINGDDIYFECKGVIGSLSQIKEYLDARKEGKHTNKNYLFGRVKITEHANDKLIMDCLDNGTIKEAEEIRKFGEEILSDQVINEDLAYKIADSFNDYYDSTPDMLDRFRNKIKQKLNAKNQTFDMKYTIKGFEDEILVALHQAMVNIYGDSGFMQTEEGMSGDINPVIRNIEMPNGDRIKIPMGKMRLPGFSNNAFIDTRYNTTEFSLVINCRIQKKSEETIEKIYNKTISILNESSIYRNSVLQITFEDEKDYPVEEPKIINTALLERNQPLILSEEVQGGIMNIIGRIKDPVGCESDGIDIKSTFLLSGKGGTGKTETMFRKITPVAIAEDMTVLYIHNSKDYAKLLSVANILQLRGWRLLLILEDIDQAFEGELRGENQQNILNTLDAGFNKDVKLISLLTTNYEEKLNSFFVRRVTDIIHFDGMDLEGAKEFINVYIPAKYKGETINYNSVYNELVGIVPSLAKRIVDKALVIRRAKGDEFITEHALLSSIKSFRRHNELSTSKSVYNKNETIIGALQTVFAVAGLSIGNLQTIADNTYYGEDKNLKMVDAFEG